MPGSVSSIQQQLYRAKSPPTLTLEITGFASLTAKSISDLRDTLDDGTRLGVAASYGKKCILRSLAFSTETRVLIVVMDGNSRTAVRKKELFSKELLCNASLEKHGFFMERIAAALYLDVGLFISNAFDVTASGCSRGSKAAYKFVLEQAGIDYPLDESVVRKTYVEQRFDLSKQHLLALRAWACHVGVKRLPPVPGASIDTSVKDMEELGWMCKCVRDADRLESKKPSTAKNDVSHDIKVTEGAIDLRCTRFKTRIRTSRTQIIRFETDQGNMKGRVKEARGRAVTVAAFTKFNTTAAIRSVVTIGKDALTEAGMSRASLILGAFEGSDTLLSNPFVRMIFFPNYPLDTLEWPELPTTQPEINFAHIDLNDAQEEAMEMCLSNEEEDRHVIIIGPPGTGKTTVIAAVIHNKVAEDPSNTVWVIAQSNVAVKNVAEKLVESGFLDFKLLVSSDFHFDWHEHLYEEIVENMIESGDFQDSANDTETKLGEARVILCTISLMSGKRIDLCMFTRIVPVQTVIVDEASQIEIGDYLPVLAKYKSTLRKMVFIGDDKQLPPYGTEDISELMSVFEWPHLRDNSIFLNIQYRMPTAIGSFISRHVYSSRLFTHHRIVTPNCCRFVDVRHGREVKTGHSWTNPAEINCALRVAKRYLREQKKFKIITPYDAQRNAIENALRAEGLTWENTVFNVDSFQGNEEDHIILSIVRTDSPGFLTNRRRTNVMLSRCKKSMLILTHRGFMQGAAALTLVGRFAEEHVPLTDGWVTVEELSAHRW